ncbi:MAG: hypothetical protein KAU95_03480, partial [Candidatus Aenigmarchaeota archaeon]|nr:hypothetical protein [Candidatus Aenigmarchaeota archaeon]
RGGNIISGTIDEVRIYNCSLTQQEIIDDMQSGLIRHGLHRSNTSSGTYEPVDGLWDDFSDGDYTNNPAWTVNGGTWTVDNNELNQSETASGWYLISSGDTSWTDYIAETRFKTISGSTKGVKLNLRTESTTTNHMGLFYRADTNQVCIYNYKGGYFIADYKTASRDYTDTGGHTLKGIVSGQNYKLYIDDVLEAEGTDTGGSQILSGKISLGSNRGNSYFDNIKVTPLIADNNYTDTSAQDVSPPDTPSSPTVTRTQTECNSTECELNISWSSVSDNGDDYFYYLNAFDDEGNENNIMPGRDSLFIDGVTVLWSNNAIDTSEHVNNIHGVYSAAHWVDSTSNNIHFDTTPSFTNGSYYIYTANVYLESGCINLNTHWRPYGSGSQTCETGKWKTIQQVFKATGGTVGLAVSVTAGTDVYVTDYILYEIKNTTITTGTKDYQVDETTGGGTDSGWQSSPYQDTGLAPNTQYTYRVRAEDNANNPGTYSTTQSNYTAAEKPTMTSVNCSGTAGNYHCNATFDMGNNSVGTQHYINETTGHSGGSDQSWTSSETVYQDTGLSVNTEYCYQIKARNNESVETSYTTEICNTVSNNLPNTTIPTLTPSTPTTNQNLNCSFTVTDLDADTLYANYTWYKDGSSYSSGQVSVTNGIESSIILGYGNTSKGEEWLCQITPYDQYDYGTPRNSTSVTIQTTEPIVNLTNPPTNWVVNSNPYFKCKATADINLQNISLYTNQSGWNIKSTNSSLSGTSATVYFNTSGFNEGNFKWSCKACDIEEACAFATENRTFTVDLTNPLINFTDPTPNNSANRNKDWAYINVSTSDTHNTSAFIDWNRSLVGYWSFDSYNSTHVYDNSTYTNDGEIHGSKTVEGKFGKGMEFDGVNDYVDCG